MKVFIDPGHNHTGNDTGAIGNGIKEQDITFLISDRLKIQLKNAGFEVKMSRNSISDNVGAGTVASSLSARANMANQWGADLFVSIHCNAGGGNGTETYCYQAGISSGYKLAQMVQDSLISNVGLTNRGVKTNSALAVLRQSNMPAVLVETAFIDNARDASILGSNEGQEKFAKAIFNGICNYAGVQTSNSKEELSLTQYEELKNEINELKNSYANIKTSTDGLIQLAKDSTPMIYNYIDENMPEWARPSIQKAVDKGYLKGDGSVGLNLDNNLLRTFVLLDRAGVLDKE